MRRLTRKDKWGMAILAISGLVMLGFFVFPVFLSQRDPESLCLEDGVIQRHHIFLIDQSDPISKDYLNKISKVFEDVVSAMGSNDKVSIMFFSGKRGIFSENNSSFCNPGSEETANPFIQNPRKVQERFERSFYNRLKTKFSSESFSKRSAESPILENLRDLGLVEAVTEKAIGRDLIIISDMIQNTSVLNQYMAPPMPFAQFQQEPGFFKVRPKLEFSSITLVYVKRKKLEHLQSRDHLQFWRSYFRAAGIGEMRVIH